MNIIGVKDIIGLNNTSTLIYIFTLFSYHNTIKYSIGFIFYWKAIHNIFAFCYHSIWKVYIFWTNSCIRKITILSLHEISRWVAILMYKLCYILKKRSSYYIKVRNLIVILSWFKNFVCSFCGIDGYHTRIFVEHQWFPTTNLHHKISPRSLFSLDLDFFLSVL